MSNQNRVQAGIPEGGQWSETAKARPPVPTFGRNYEQSRYDMLRANKFVPADQVKLSGGTATKWYQAAEATGEFNTEGGFERMSRSPKAIGSLRQTYRGQDFALTMPSVTSVRRMAAEVDPRGTPFDIPVSTPDGKGGQTIGWVRVSQDKGSGWNVQTLGDRTNSDSATVGAGVKSMLEARRITDHLDGKTKKDMIADFRETRRQSFAKRSHKLKSPWVDSVGFDEHEKEVLVTTTSGRSYRYPYGKDVLEAIRTTHKPGQYINKVLKGTGEVEVSECQQCHRTFTSVGTHQCPAGRRKDGPHMRTRHAATKLHERVTKANS